MIPKRECDSPTHTWQDGEPQLILILGVVLWETSQVWRIVKLIGPAGWLDRLTSLKFTAISVGLIEMPATAQSGWYQV